MPHCHDRIMQDQSVVFLLFSSFAQSFSISPPPPLKLLSLFLSYIWFLIYAADPTNLSLSSLTHIQWSFNNQDRPQDHTQTGTWKHQKKNESNSSIKHSRSRYVEGGLIYTKFCRAQQHRAVGNCTEFALLCHLSLPSIFGCNNFATFFFLSGVTACNLVQLVFPFLWYKYTCRCCN